jgi:hypothetical protein
MKTTNPLTISRTFFLLVIALAGFSGCASMGGSNTVSLQSAADFRTGSPSTPEKQTVYSEWHTPDPCTTGSGLATSYMPKQMFNQVQQ